VASGAVATFFQWQLNPMTAASHSLITPASLLTDGIKYGAPLNWHIPLMLSKNAEMCSVQELWFLIRFPGEVTKETQILTRLFSFFLSERLVPRVG
jgi:hypothetical protein